MIHRMNSKTMHLSNEKIQELVKTKPNEKELQAGVKHQERLRFHTETVLNKNDLSGYYRDFKSWICSEDPEILAPDKQDRFFQLLSTPIPTIELTESIFSRLHRVFQSQDSYFNYKFTDDSLESDWAEYKDQKFWSTEGFEAMQTAIDSVWIVDLPADQLSEFPEPKNRLIDLESVIAIKNNSNNECEYVIFRIGDYVYAYDDEMLRAYESEGDNLTLYAEAAHGLGYTPARMFWSESLVSRNTINKESPITKVLSDLDWLLFHQTSKKYLDLANAYPVTVIYEADRDFEDDDLTDKKAGGKQPVGSNLMGSGSVISVKMPRGNDEHDPMSSGPIKVISPEIGTLEWHVKEEMRLNDKIFRSVVGVDQEVKNDAAKNEMQIQSSYESQVSVLLRIKKNFEAIHTFADKTICKLRYDNRFIGCEIDYGTNFFLKDIEGLQKELSDAKQSGASESLIETINANMLSTKYRDDKRNKERAEIIHDLDPLPNYSIKDAIDVFKNGGVDKLNFIIKINLLSFVRRFERENIDVVRFGSLGNYLSKIEKIRESFVLYAQEMTKTNDNEII